MKKVISYLFVICLLANCTPNKKIIKEKPIETIQGISNNKGLGSMKGTVVEDGSYEPLPFATIQLLQNDVSKMGTTTDLNGAFKFDTIPVGRYQLKIDYVGLGSYSRDDVVIEEGKVVVIEQIVLENQIQTLKPIIYLYPTEPTDVHVELKYDGQLTHTYPKYPKQGWDIKANPDGTLTDKLGKEYYALFWEGETDYEYKVEEGFVVAGEESIEFLEDTLEKLGLNRKEANEFIIFWIPILEKSPYNLIHFSTTQYEELAKLKITPTPETIIRVMMVFKPLDTPISIMPQDLSIFEVERKGFTVVEWGGQQLPTFSPKK